MSSVVSSGSRLSTEASRTVKILDRYPITFVVEESSNDPISRSILQTGLFAVPLDLQLMQALLRPGQTVLDLGAHIGTYAFAAAAAGCRVIAVEPDPRNVASLRAGASRNGFDQLVVIESVAADRPGAMFFGPCGPWGHLQKVTETEDLTTIEVPAVVIDDLLAAVGWQRVDFVKIDIVGYEPFALRGMKRLLSGDDAPFLVFESNAHALSWYGQTPAELFAFLEGLGYRCYHIDRQNPGRLAPLTSTEVQPEAVADFFAAKRLPRQLMGSWLATGLRKLARPLFRKSHVGPQSWHNSAPFSREELAARILAGCTDANPTARWHCAKAILATPWLRFWPGISDSLQGLQSDANLWVQRAATLPSTKTQKVKRPVAKAPPPTSKTLQQPMNECEKIPFDNNDLPKIRGLLQDWKLHVKQYAGMARHDGQRFIEPYVLQRRQSGFLVNFLVATADAQAWYDHVYPWIDIDVISQFNMIEPGAIVFDLGANHGFYSVLFAKMAGSKGRVYAFEPFPVMGDVIKFNARLNDVHIDVYEVGLSKEKKDATASLTAQCIALDNFGDSVKISLDSLDNYAHLAPNFLKIDIEGAELDALEGAEKLLEHRPNIYLEVHTSFLKHFGRRVEEIFEVLPLSDYYCYVMAPGKPLKPFNGELEIEDHFSLFLLKESPVRKVAA